METLKSPGSPESEGQSNEPPPILLTSVLHEIRTGDLGPEETRCGGHRKSRFYCSVSLDFNFKVEREIIINGSHELSLHPASARTAAQGSNKQLTWLLKPVHDTINL